MPCGSRLEGINEAEQPLIDSDEESWADPVGEVGEVRADQRLDLANAR